MKRTSLWLFLMTITIVPVTYSQENSGVKVWEEELILPTYLVEANDVNPMFFRNESYQGASRVIYPYPMMDNFSPVKKDQSYKALYLENEYIKLCVLPELGGRLFYATDKTNQYEIFYRQHVIKPAHIGMLGAWISGGIEWCVFHHHRASTFLPMDYALSDNADGSKTIWIGETEPRHRMKWTIGITLRPGSSLLEVKVKMINRTEVTNSILYWANVATHVNDDYQVIFPPSVDVVTYHAKNSFAHWPITHETYNGHDYYQNGIDASWWKNHPEPISFFAHHLKEGFLAGYDYGKDAGTLHVADPHIVAGAKLWEWGPGPRGSFWDTQLLTDNDGPYAELMVGAWSDNQPDYSWIKPYEMKEFTQYWYPIRNIRGAKNANTFACVNMELAADGKVFVGINTTRRHENARVKLTLDGKNHFSGNITIDPAHPFVREITVPRGTPNTALHLVLESSSGENIISYQPVKKEYNQDLPEEVTPPPLPQEIKTTEELFFTGLRIRQFHHARLRAMDYFLEALKRDPLDSRCNTEAGIFFQQKGRYDSAVYYFRKALYRPAYQYTRPLNTEAFYHLGVTLEKMERYEDAYDTLYRATWDYPFRSPAYYHLARISCLQKKYPRALEEINQSLVTNLHHIPALHLKATLLRKLGLDEEALMVLDDLSGLDPLDVYSRFEKYLAWIESGETTSAENEKKILISLLRNYYESYLELAVEYLNSGFFEEALVLLNMAAASGDPVLAGYPMIHYYLGYINDMNGKKEEARENFIRAEELPTDYCFPYRLESIPVLTRAIQTSAKKSRAYYYLGNLLFDKQPVEAIRNWKMALEEEPGLSIACRNIGWGLFYHSRKVEEAIPYYELAIRYNPSDALYYYELDQLYELNNTAPEKRLEMLTGHHEDVKKRGDALSREIKALVQNGQYDLAIQYLDENHFYARELADDLHEIYVNAHLLRGLTFLNQSQQQEALEDFIKADQFPENHQIGRMENYIQNAQIYYLTGLAFEKTGNKKKAMEFYRKSAGSSAENSEHLYEQALSWQKLGEKDQAARNFEWLIRLGNNLIGQETSIDFFAKFGEELALEKKIARGYFMQGLGYLGKGEVEKARSFIKQSIDKDYSLVWAHAYLKEIKE